MLTVLLTHDSTQLSAKQPSLSFIVNLNFNFNFFHEQDGPLISVLNEANLSGLILWLNNFCNIGLHGFKWGIH
jgi:hypothetical protein